MSFWDAFYRYMDLGLMPLFRLPQEPIWGFYLGVLFLAAVSVVLGDVAFGLALRVDKRQLARFSAEVVRLNNLSIDAIESGNRDAYQASNKLANEAFGRLFFLKAAFSMATLWPLPFALAWMQYRFFDVRLPFWGVDWALGYTGVFILFYILARILWAPIRPFVPFVRENARVFTQASESAGRMRGWADLLATPGPKATGPSPA